MIAEIISIGDELITGQTLNSNASWLAGNLDKTGVATRQITIVSDDKEEIERALSEAERRADLILITGGLGPTKDDNTRDVLCTFFNSRLIESQVVSDDIKAFFAKRGLEVTETNRKQSLVPENCSILRNKNGTAPGLWFERKNKIFIAMPGVPFELKPMVKDHVIPFLKEKITGNFIIHRTILTHGIGESFLADKLNNWEKEFPSNIKLAYLPSPGLVKLQLSGTGENQQQIKEDVGTLINKLKKIIPGYIFGENHDTMQSIVGKLLKEKHATLSIAESCTGGMISHLVTSVSGASQYFAGSIIAYDNNIKINQLNVDKSLIEKYGAVSKQVAESMAAEIKKSFNTSYAIATTGIAGPEGGTDEKPVGLVWIAVAANDHLISKKFLFGDNRERNMIIASTAALNMLRKVLSGKQRRR